MAGRPKGGQKRAHKGPIYGPATLDARNIRSTLSMGMWPQGGGEYFSSTPPAVDAPRHPEPQCPPVAACARSPFQYIELSHPGNLKCPSFWNWYFLDCSNCSPKVHKLRIQLIPSLRLQRNTGAHIRASLTRTWSPGRPTLPNPPTHLTNDATKTTLRRDVIYVTTRARRRAVANMSHNSFSLGQEK